MCSHKQFKLNFSILFIADTKISALTSCGNLLLAHCHNTVWFVSLKEEVTLLQLSHTYFFFHGNPIFVVDNYISWLVAAFC